MTLNIRYISKSILIVFLVSLSVVAAAQHSTSEVERVSTCTLADQIAAQNIDRPVGDCAVLSYHEVFELHEDIVLTEALPVITSHITIDGQGHTISGAGRHRIFEVDGGVVKISDLRMIRGGAAGGSAIYAHSGAWVHLDRISVTHNAAHLGGTIQVSFSRLSVMESVIAFNKAYGGGAIKSTASAVTIETSTLASNTARYGGAIELFEGTATIKNSELRDNEVEVSGGAIRSSDGIIQVLNSKFGNNRARSGGAISSFGDNILLSISSSYFSDNLARQEGGAIYVAGSPELYVSDSQFKQNSAGQFGGAIVAKDGPIFISYCSVENNRSMHGSGIYVREGSITILNSVVAENISTESGEQLHLSESEVRYMDIRDD